MRKYMTFLLKILMFIFVLIWLFNLNTFWYVISNIKKNIILTVISDIKSEITIKNFNQIYMLRKIKDWDFFNNENNKFLTWNNIYSQEIIFSPQIIANGINKFKISWYYKIKDTNKLIKYNVNLIFNNIEKVLFKWNIYLIVFWKNDFKKSYIKNIIKDNSWTIKIKKIKTIDWEKKIYFYTNADKIDVEVESKENNQINIFLNNFLWFKFNYYYFVLFFLLSISFWFFYFIIKRKKFIKL